MKKNNFQRGQMLLIVVLTMVVVLTIGLAVASRTVTNLKVSKQNEESQRAFQAAEAGIEQALERLENSPGVGESFSLDLMDSKAEGHATIEQEKGTAVLLNGGNQVEQDKGIDIWLSTYSDFTPPQYGGTFYIFWGTPNQNLQCLIGSGENTTPALEVVVLTSSLSDPTFSKYVMDPCGRIPGAEITAVGSYTVLGQSFLYRKSIDILPTSGLIAKAIPLYNATKIAICSASSCTSGTPFQTQGSRITSRGTSGETVRKLEYFVPHPQIPTELFPYSLVSQN